MEKRRRVATKRGRQKKSRNLEEGELNSSIVDDLDNNNNASSTPVLYFSTLLFGLHLKSFLFRYVCSLSLSFGVSLCVE